SSDRIGGSVSAPGARRRDSAARSWVASRSACSARVTAWSRCCWTSDKVSSARSARTRASSRSRRSPRRRPLIMHDTGRDSGSVCKSAMSVSSNRDALGHVGNRPGRELVGGLPALLAVHVRDDVLVEVQVVVAGTGGLVIAVLALVDRGEVAAVLAGLALDVHDRVPFDSSDGRCPLGAFTPPVGAPASPQDALLPQPARAARTMRTHAADDRRMHGRPPRILPPT